MFRTLTLAALVAACTPAPTPGPDPIPRVLQGRWGLVAADCTSTRGDAKGLMVVGTDSIRFYESTAHLRSAAERAATRLVGDFDFTGEGYAWTRRMILDVQDGGATLVRREYGDGAVPGPLRYRACG